jgi:hypothetical protein
MSEVKGMKSAEEPPFGLAVFFRRRNALNSTDARQIEDAFQARLATDGPDGHAPAVMSGSSAQ